MSRRQGPGCCTSLLIWSCLFVALWAFYEIIWNPPPISAPAKSRLIRSDDFEPAKCRRVRRSELDACAEDAKALTLLAMENHEDVLTPHHIGAKQCYFVINVAAPNTPAIYAAYINPDVVEVGDFFRADHHDRLCGRRRLRHRFPKYISWNWTNPVTQTEAFNRSNSIYLSTRLATAFHLLDGKDICA